MLLSFKKIPLFPLIIIVLITSLGIMVLYSAADGSLFPWGIKQMARIGIGLGLMLLVAHFQVRSLYHVAYGIYAISLLALGAVELLGFIGMGAQRWINLGILNIQPSEVMRIGLILSLARYFHEVPEDQINSPRQLIMPFILVLLPTILVLRQPDLGTAVLLILSSVTIFFMAGVRISYFIGAGALLIASIPILWTFLHDYQKKRVLIFLNPESDPTKSGYHIIQSKIALGSGGLFGKGFLQGTQSHFDFLPEKQTDFIFTMFCEEFGFMGALCLIGIYGILIMYNIHIAKTARGQFARLTAIGLSTIFFCYMFINMSMVSGLLPVVGVPLPLFSYGGTSMVTLLISQGLLFSIYFKQKSHTPFG